MKEHLLGVDIGGTKCAVTYGYVGESGITLVDEERFPTGAPQETIAEICKSLQTMMKKHGFNENQLGAIGISCGGPLNTDKGLIMSPPNLPGWDGIPIVSMISKNMGVKVGLQNDANACALAEWTSGAGRGTENMVFMTFGTGLGAGLILDGRLYSGTNDNAGEIGHVRLTGFGPVGYGKAGSFEGFCSGGGIAQIARMLIAEKQQMGIVVPWCAADEVEQLTAQIVAEAAYAGDELALEAFDISSRKLGEGLAVIIDILNPELIVIGGVYTRCQALMEPRMLEIIGQEALPESKRVCRIVGSQLGEQIGSYSALSVAADLLTTKKQHERIDL